MSNNLNELLIPTLPEGYGVPLKDYSTVVNNGNTKILIYFRNLEHHLCELIQESDVVVGCTPWLTNNDVISAIQTLDYGASIVVQKEYFLQVFHGKPDRKQQFRYSVLQASSLMEEYFKGELLSKLDPFPWPNGVRCVGHAVTDNYNFANKRPLMHNKFLVFCNVKNVKDNYGEHRKLFPYAVWTGSFNFSENAPLCFENAVYIIDETAAQAYYSEWQQIMALSEPINWKSESMSPECTFDRDL